LRTIILPHFSTFQQDATLAPTLFALSPLKRYNEYDASVATGSTNELSLQQFCTHPHKGDYPMPDNSSSLISDSEEEIQDHHPSDADFYNEELELPVRRKRAASGNTKKRSSRASSSGSSRNANFAAFCYSMPYGLPPKACCHALAWGLCGIYSVPASLRFLPLD
jgi:hypothetical protein